MPDPGKLLAYNRYLYGYGNPMRYTDPTGHLSEDEIGTYFGYRQDPNDPNSLSARQQMLDDGWDESLVNWLFDADTLFGDAFTFVGQNNENNTAMLVLFETGQVGAFDRRRQWRGGFYGLAGQYRGVEVNRSVISSPDSSHPDAVFWEEQFTGGNYDDLPKKTGSDGRNYYDTQEYRLLNIWGVAQRALSVKAATDPLLTWTLGWGEIIEFGAGVQGVIYPGHTSYPAIPVGRPYGNASLLESFWSPLGYYKR